MGYAVWTAGTLAGAGAPQSVSTKEDAEVILVSLYGDILELPSPAAPFSFAWATGADAIQVTHAAVVYDATPQQVSEAYEVLATSAPFVDYSGATVVAQVHTYTSQPTTAPNLALVAAGDRYGVTQSLAFGPPGPRYIGAERAQADQLVDLFRSAQSAVTLSDADLLMTAVEPVLAALTAGVCGVAWRRWRLIADPDGDASWQGLPITPASAQDIDDVFVAHFRRYPRDLS